MTIHLGVDLGGTKIEVLAIDHEGLELARRRVPTPSASRTAILEATRDVVTALEHDVGRAATIGIGTPGSLSPFTGLLRNSNTTVLNGVALDRELEAALGRDVVIANDADCFALSEATDGAGRDHDVVFAVIIGTGTGAGIAMHGRVDRGPNAVRGEWGHNPLPWAEAHELPGPPCYCGRTGCIETWLSGAGLGRAYVELRPHAPTPSNEAIARAAAEGDDDASAAIARYADRLARSLASVVDVLDPDVIVLGGGMSNIAGLYELVPTLLPRYVFGGEARTPIVQARHGDSSGVRGAAWLGRRTLRGAAT